MTLPLNTSNRESGYYNGLWSVDHIIPAKDCMVFRGKEPYSGYVVRLVKYKEDVEKNVGLRYVLIDKDLYPEKIDFGNTYYIPKDITDKISVTFSGVEYSIRHLVDPVETASSVNESIDNKIQKCLNRGLENDNPDKGNRNAKYLTKDKGRKVWVRIHIHHVGQGDTIVIELPDNQIWMVDARFWRKDRREDFDNWMLSKFNKKKIDRLIISHFHYDHIHSVPYIIQNYNPDQVIVTDSLSHRTASVVRALHYAGDRLYVLPKEEKTSFGALQIQLHRTDKFSAVGNSKNPNDHEISVMLKSENGFAFLAGDIPGNMCNDLLSSNFCNGIRNTDQKIIYKVSHHGSKAGYDAGFFNNFDPWRSVISCGQNNRYNHPHRPPIGELSNPTMTWKWDRNSRSYEL